LDKEQLIAFETDIANEFNAGNIRAPVHLSDGNEEQLIEIFKDVKPDDWVCCTWRSHYHCLLKGVPPDKVMSEIMAGRSIALCFPEYHIVSSAIAGGIVPIALGIAMAIKLAGGNEQVWCFCGEMTAETGIFSECLKYAINHSLPIRFVIEDNGKSVCTDTAYVWGALTGWEQEGGVIYYRYTPTYPHAGAGKRVEF
jgi:TPP-dependent pyruvate/acetoin dehydrogenase alpha subunit